MWFSRFRLEAASLCAVVLLAACGGGGSSSSAGTATASNAPANSSAPGNDNAVTPATTSTAGAVTLLPAVAAAPVLPSPSGDATADGIAYLSAMRQAIGLSEPTSDPGLTTASLDHVTYLVDNDAAGHNETAGLPGYTGATPQARIAAQGNYTVYGEVVVSGETGAFANSVTPVQTLFDAPYHRIIMLDDFQSMGVAASANSVWEAFNIDFGNTSGTLPSTELVAYPYAGQQGVPTSWFANESPNPFANATQYELTTVGYPVTIQSGMAGTLSTVNFTITDASGNSVPCLAQTPQTDPSELFNGAMCVPYQPLAADTNYTVNVTGVLTNGGQTQSIDVTWSFTTATSAVSAVEIPGAPASRPLPQF
jgi:uncharacterized protein YkwD